MEDKEKCRKALKSGMTKIQEHKEGGNSLTLTGLEAWMVKGLIERLFDIVEAGVVVGLVDLKDDGGDYDA